MSWSCGPWPIPDTAAPANPAEPPTNRSKARAGMPLQRGVPWMSTYWARMYSTLSCVRRARTSSAVMAPPPDSVRHGGGRLLADQPVLVEARDGKRLDELGGLAGRDQLGHAAAGHGPGLEPVRSPADVDVEALD